MDPPLQYLLFAISILFLSIKLYRNRRRRPNLPPGPSKLPIIGSMHHLFRSLPHRKLRDLAAAHGPLMHLQLGEISTVVVSSGEVAKQMLKTHDANFSSRPTTLFAEIMLYGRRGMILVPYGDYWRQMRMLCAVELLNSNRVRSFQRVREEESVHLIAAIRAGAGAALNLTQLLYSFTYDITSRIALGVKGGRDAGRYLTAVKKSLELSSGFNAADLFPSAPLLAWLTGIKPKLESYHREVDKILESTIKERRAQPIVAAEDNSSSSFLDVLLSLQARGALGFPLTDNNIKAIIFDVFAAGSGTSASALVWAMLELVKNPGAMRRAQDEVRGGAGEYMRMVMKEGLRLHPPVPLVPRESIEECEVGGFRVPAGSRVVVNLWAMGRDERTWGEDAAEFRPERFEGRDVDFKGGCYEYIPFGAGRRMCPGAQFGMATVEVALTRMLRDFDWSVPGGAEALDTGESAGLGARKKSDLVLCAAAAVGA